MRIDPFSSGEAQFSEHSYSRRPRPDILAVARRCHLAGNVLDVGCAGGLVGEALLRDGNVHTVTGIELDPASADDARTRLTQVIVGDATDDAILPSGPFDGAILADVLEHVASPEQLLKRVLARMAFPAIVIVSLPNVRHFRNLWNVAVRGQWHYEDEGICDRTHLRFFTFSTATDLIRQFGLQPTVVLGTMTERATRICRWLPGTAHFLSNQFVFGCTSSGSPPDESSRG